MQTVKLLTIAGLLVAVLAGTVTLIQGGLRQARGFPVRIAFERSENQFKWLAASELVDMFGFLDSSLLPREIMHAHGDLEALFLESRRAFNEGTEPPPCLPLGSSAGELPSSFPGFPKTVEQVVSDAAVVVRGTVMGAEGGFAQGAGMMLEVRVDEWLLETSAAARRETMFVFYPAGDFSVGHARICAATFSLPPAPGVGAEVLLFPYRFYFDPDAEFVHFGQFGAYRANDRVRAPKILEGVPELANGANWDILASRFRRVSERRNSARALAR